MTLPTDYSGLQGWWDASQESFANNDAVATFTDRSGNSRNLTQATGANQPLFKTAQFPLGGPGIDFDGSNDFLVNATALSSFISAGAYTLFFVIQVDAVASNAANTYDNVTLWGDSGGFAGVHLKSAGPTIMAYNWDGSDDHNNLTLALSTSYVYMQRHESGNLYSSLDGAAETSVASGNTSTLTGTQFVGGVSGLEPFNGRIAEFFVYNVALTAPQIAALTAYLTNKWVDASDANADAAVASGTGAANNASVPSPATTVSLTLNAHSGVLAYATDPTASAGEVIFDFISGRVVLGLAGAEAAAAANADAAVAAGVGAANTTQSTVTPSAAVSTGAGTANTAQPSVKPSAAVGAGAGAANAATTTVTTSSGSASGTGVGNGATGSLRVTAGAPTSAGAANNATVPTGTPAPATEATAVGAAHTATTTVAPLSGSGSGAGAGNSATSALATTAGAATSSGEAVTASVTAAGTAGAAVGAGAAHDATITTSVNAQTATSAGSVPAPTVDIAADATAAPAVASAVGAAFDATVSTALPDPNARTITVRDRGHTVTLIHRS